MSNLSRGSAVLVLVSTLVAAVAPAGQSTWYRRYHGNGVDDQVFHLLVGSEDLYAAGFFLHAGNVEASRSAKWDGNAWSPLGPSQPVYDTWAPVGPFVVNGGVLYAVGTFTPTDGATRNSVVKWDGSTWFPISSGFTDRFGYMGSVYALAASNGVLYAAGEFAKVDGIAANNIARWDGYAWSPLGSGIDPSVRALAASSGILYAGGMFWTAGGVAANNVAQWNGLTWSPLGTGLSNPGATRLARATALTVSNGILYASGEFTNAGGVTANNIAKWNGVRWSPLGSGIEKAGSQEPVRALAASNGFLYAGGQFSKAGDVAANSIAKWDGSMWSPLGSGITGIVTALELSGETLYAGGYFTTAGGAVAFNIAQWNNATWSGVPQVSGADQMFLPDYPSFQSTYNVLKYDRGGTLHEVAGREDAQLLFRTRAKDGTWTEEIVTAASESDTSILFDSHDVPHIFIPRATGIEHWVRFDGQWSLRELIAPSPESHVSLGPGVHVYFGPNDVIHIASGGREGFGPCSYGTNRDGQWEWRYVLWYDSRINAGFGLAVEPDNSANLVTVGFGQDETGKSYSLVSYVTNSTVNPAPIPLDAGWTGDVVERQLQAGDGTYTILGDLGVSIAVDSRGTVGIATSLARHASTGSTSSASLIYYQRKRGGWTRDVVASTADGYVLGDGNHFTGSGAYLLFDGFDRPHIVFTDIAGVHINGAQSLKFGQIRHAYKGSSGWRLHTVYPQRDANTMSIHDSLTMALSSGELSVAATAGQYVVGGGWLHGLVQVSVPCFDGPCGPTPQPTATPSPTPTTLCAGACDGRGEVSIDDIVKLVNIALGSADASTCARGNPGGGAVTIDVIIEAVNHALSGC